jgi:hypothetical protein
LLSSISATASAKAPTGFAKRFGWKKPTNDKKSSRGAFSDDLPDASYAA